MSTIELTDEFERVSWPELVRVFELAPLGRKRDLEKLERAFRNSLIRVFAYDNQTLIGAGRAVSDGVWRATVYDVAVLPQYQGKGVGTQIMNHIIREAKVDIIMLFAAPGKEQFYERYGFRKMKTAMAIMPNEEEARQRGLLE